MTLTPLQSTLIFKTVEYTVTVAIVAPFVIGAWWLWNKFMPVPFIRTRPPSQGTRVLLNPRP